MKYYTYIHYKADTNEPFYIGKGTGNRVSVRLRRSSYWKSIVAKHGLHTEILMRFYDESQAFEHERFLIDTFKALGYKLCNFTEGGEGSSGYRHTEETKQKMRKPKKVLRTQQHSLNQSLAMTRFKTIATCIDTGEQLTFVGKPELEAFGFNAAHVYKCCNGQRKSHKGYTFARCEISV